MLFRVLHNPEITDGERAWIMRSIDYRLHRVQAELSWLDQQITGEYGAEGVSKQTNREVRSAGGESMVGKAISIDKGSRQPPAFSPQFREGWR